MEFVVLWKPSLIVGCLIEVAICVSASADMPTWSSGKELESKVRSFTGQQFPELVQNERLWRIIEARLGFHENAKGHSCDL